MCWILRLRPRYPKRITSGIHCRKLGDAAVIPVVQAPRTRKAVIIQFKNSRDALKRRESGSPGRSARSTQKVRHPQGGGIHRHARARS